MRAAAVIVLLSALPARAGIYDEAAGVRSQAMGGAHRGLGTSNDTLFLNPAGMVSAPRYSVDVSYSFDRAADLSNVSISAVDSKSSPVAGAVGYTHVRGDENGVDARLHRIYLAAAYPIVEGFGFGMTVRHLRGDYTDNAGQRHTDLSIYNGDIGLLLALAQGFGFGLSYHNVIRTDEPRLMPATVGLGGAYQNAGLAVAVDMTLDVESGDGVDRPPSYHIGAEYFAAQQYPIRLGYQSRPFQRSTGQLRRENIIGAGVGWLSDGGALEVGFDQSIERPQHWTLTGALKIFL